MYPASDDVLVDVLRQAFDWARSGDVLRLSDLLNAGCPVNLTNDKGDTLLILAAYYQQAAVVALLVEHGADVERVNDNGQTALGSGVFRQNDAIVDQLLSAGANPATGHRSALSVADFFGLTDMHARLSKSTNSGQ